MTHTLMVPSRAFSLAATLALVSMVGMANAQNSTVSATLSSDAAANHSPDMPAVKTSTTAATTMAPAAGRNSYTMKQAAAHLKDKGYTNVSGLKKDANGVWRGKAMKNGKRQNVALDYQGNISVQ